MTRRTFEVVDGAHNGALVELAERVKAEALGATVAVRHGKFLGHKSNVILPDEISVEVEP